MNANDIKNSEDYKIWQKELKNKRQSKKIDANKFIENIATMSRELLEKNDYKTNFPKNFNGACESIKKYISDRK